MQPVAKKKKKKKKNRFLPIFSGISACLWNQREKSHIFEKSALRKFRTSKTNHEKGRIMEIFAETTSYK